MKLGRFLDEKAVHAASVTSGGNRITHEEHA